jgi:acyl carrier protein
MPLQRLITSVEDATQSMPGTVSATTALESLDGWDSLGMVALIGIVSEQRKVDLSMDELRECSTVLDLNDLIARRSP